MYAGKRVRIGIQNWMHCVAQKLIITAFYFVFFFAFVQVKNMDPKSENFIFGNFFVIVSAEVGPKKWGRKKWYQTFIDEIYSDG